MTLTKGDIVRATTDSYGGAYVKGETYVVSRYDRNHKTVYTERDSLGSPSNGWKVTNFELVNTSPSFAHSFSPGGHGTPTITNTPRAGESDDAVAARSEPRGSAPVLGTQVGGSHYTDCAIQPIEYIWANKLGFSEGNIVKYITRWRSKGGIKDLEKAKHHIALLIEHETSLLEGSQ